MFHRKYASVLARKKEREWEREKRVPRRPTGHWTAFTIFRSFFFSVHSWIVWAANDRREGEAHSKGKSKRISKIFSSVFSTRLLLLLVNLEKAFRRRFTVKSITERLPSINTFDDSTDLFKFRITSYIIAFAVFFFLHLLLSNSNQLAILVVVWLFDLVGSSFFVVRPPLLRWKLRRIFTSIERSFE